MKDSFNVKNVFSYIEKKFYIIIIFIIIFMLLGALYVKAAPQTEETEEFEEITEIEETEEPDEPDEPVEPEKTELAKNGKYYKYNQTITIVPPEDMDMTELERFNSITLPDFTRIVNSEDSRLKLYNNIRDDLEIFREDKDILKEIFPNAETLKGVFDYAITARVSANNATLSITATSEEKARQYATQYISYIMPKLKNISDNVSIEIGEGVINEIPLEVKDDAETEDIPEEIIPEETVPEEAVPEEALSKDDISTIIIFIFLGILVGFIIILLMYTLSGTVRDEFELKSIFSKIPVLSVFSQKRKNLSQAAVNFKTALNTLKIDDYIVTAPNILKPREKDYILQTVGINGEKFDDFVTDTEKFYQDASSAQGILIAAKRFETEIDSLKNLIDSLELNKINIIGFILYY